MDYTKNFSIRYGSPYWDIDLINKYKEYGVCIVENVFTEEECDRNIDEVVSTIEKLGSNVKRDDPKTWIAENLPSQVRPGMFQSILCNLPVIWRVRGDARIHQLFSILYSNLRNKNITNLISSIDGINIKPNHVGPYHDPFKDNDWPHIDQTSGNLFDCIQGQLVLSNTTACFRCSPKSFLIFNKILELTKTTSSDKWCKLDTSNKELITIIQYLLNDIGGKWQIPIIAPKGSFIFWSSSTIHSSQFSSKVEDNSYDIWNGWRAVFYICLRPYEDFLTNKNEPNAALKKRQKIIQENRSTNHWGERMFSKVQGGRFCYMKKYHPAIEELNNNPGLLYKKLNIPDLWLNPNIRILNI
jgi:hypothetical protein